MSQANKIRSPPDCSPFSPLSPKESGINPTLLRSDTYTQPQRNRTASAPYPNGSRSSHSMTSVASAQPPEHSAAPLRLPRPTQTAITPSLIPLRRPSEESGWLCRVCHSTASRGAFHSKPRMRQFYRRESSFRSVQFLNCGVTSLAPPQTP